MPLKFERAFPHWPSLLAQQQVHDPTTAHVRAIPATVLDNLLAIAAGIHQCIG